MHWLPRTKCSSFTTNKWIMNERRTISPFHKQVFSPSPVASALGWCKLRKQIIKLHHHSHDYFRIVLSCFYFGCLFFHMMKLNKMLQISKWHWTALKFKRFFSILIYARVNSLLMKYHRFTNSGLIIWRITTESVSRIVS